MNKLLSEAVLIQLMHISRVSAPSVSDSRLLSADLLSAGAQEPLSLWPDEHMLTTTYCIFCYAYVQHHPRY